MCVCVCACVCACVHTHTSTGAPPSTAGPQQIHLFISCCTYRRACAPHGPPHQEGQQAAGAHQGGRHWLRVHWPQSAAACAVQEDQVRLVSACGRAHRSGLLHQTSCLFSKVLFVRFRFTSEACWASARLPLIGRDSCVTHTLPSHQPARGSSGLWWPLLYPFWYCLTIIDAIPHEVYVPL